MDRMPDLPLPTNGGGLLLMVLLAVLLLVWRLYRQAH